MDGDGDCRSLLTSSIRSSDKGGSAGLSRSKVVVSRDGTLGFVHLLVARCRAQFAVDVPGLGRRDSGGGGSEGGSGRGGCSALGFVASELFSL